MKKFILALLPAVLSFLAAGCTQDPVSGEDIKYREIRVDAFSNWWLTTKVNAEDVDGNVVTTVNGYTYTLLDDSFDKTATLPAHVVKNNNGYKEVFYTIEGEPSTLSCYIERKGWFAFPEEGEEEDAVVVEEFPGDSTYHPNYYSYDPDGENSWMFTTCPYFPGKGFRVPAYMEAGTVVIRY